MIRSAATAPQGADSVRQVPAERAPRELQVELTGLRNASSVSVMSPAEGRQRRPDPPGTAWKVDRLDPTPLHEQVAAEIRRAIAEGEAAPGGRIPQAKDLAAVLGVNTNTVLRALRVLRDEGLLELRRGRDTIVTGTAEQSAVLTQAKALIRFARERGYQRDELIALIQGIR